MLPHLDAAFVNLTLEAKQKKIQQLNSNLGGNWQRSRFIYYPSSEDTSTDYDIHCNYKPPGSPNYVCNHKQVGKTKSIRCLITHWHKEHEIDLAQLVNLVYDYEMNAKTQREEAQRKANGTNSKAGMKQTILDNFKPRTRREELLIGLCRRPWNIVEEEWYKIETQQIQTPLITNPRTVGFFMRDYAYRLQDASFSAMSGRSGVLIYDSGTIWNWRFFPLMFVCHGFKPILISVNPDEVFQDGEHTAVEINRLICQATHALKTAYDITVRFCVADGAANGQSMVPGRSLENLDQQHAAVAVGLLDDAETLAPLLTSRDDKKEQSDVNRLIDDAAPPASETRVAEASSHQFLAMDISNKNLVQVSPFAKYWAVDPPSRIPPPKVIDFPHIINNITMLVVKNDPAVQAAVAKVDQIENKLNENGNWRLLRKPIPRSVVTRWNTHALRLDTAGTEFERILKDPSTPDEFEDFDDEDILIIKKGAAALSQLNHLSNIAQSNRACFFDCLSITGRLRALCAKSPNNPEKTKYLREAIVVPEHQGKMGKTVPLFNRWTWLCNDVVTVLAALCPNSIVIQETPAKSPLGVQNIARFLPFVKDRLHQWFSPKIAEQYMELCLNGGDIFVSIDGKLTVSAEEDPQVTCNDCVTFWTKLGQTYNEYNELADAVVQLFLLPSTEADLERLFSLIKNIVTDKRKSLTPTNIEACILVFALYNNFTTNGKAVFKRQADRSNELVSTISRSACEGILAFNECVRHNASCGAGAILPEKYKVDEVKALLFTSTNQAHFHDGRVKIMIDRSQQQATLRERVPPALIHFKNEIKKADKVNKTTDEDRDVACGICDRLLTDHQDIVEGIDETIECAKCEKWIHYSCTRFNRDAWIDLIKRANKDNYNYICPKCRQDSRRRRQRPNKDDDDDDVLMM